MDRTKILEILLKGVDLWNEWRRDNPEINHYLANYNFKDTNLNNAILIGANLSAVNLSYSNLIGAALWDANLKGADLIKANLKGASLRGADLSYTMLLEANLSGVDLSAADLTSAYLLAANLSGANLRGAKSLTIEQLRQVKTLYGAKLDPDLLEEVKEKYLHLLEEPKDEENR